MRQLEKKYLTDDEILKHLKDAETTLQIAIESGRSKEGFSNILATKLANEYPNSTKMAITKHVLRRLLSLHMHDGPIQNQEKNFPNFEMKSVIAISDIVSNREFTSDIGDTLQKILGNLIRIVKLFRHSKYFVYINLFK